MNLRAILRHARRSTFEMLGSDRYSHLALNDIDRKLAGHLKRRNGVFVEAGANDGLTYSNTYYLERFHGWSGILVEAIPSLYQRACRNRPGAKVYNFALVPPENEGRQVELIYGNLMSLVAGAMGSDDADEEHIRKARQHEPSAGSYRISVSGRTLSSLIEDAGKEHVDLLSLDVEGYEAEVLRGLDLKKHRPDYICVESRDRAAIDAQLLPHYRLVDQLSELDFLYRAN